MFTIRPTTKGGNGHSNNTGGHNGNGNGGAKVETVLGPGMFYRGNLSGAAGVRIEGAFEGTISLRGPLVIADGAKVTADVQASAVSVAGSLKGNITASKVEILSTGRIWGDLTTAAFATEDGAFLRGKVTVQDEIALPVAPEAIRVEAAAAA